MSLARGEGPSDERDGTAGAGRPDAPPPPVDGRDLADMAEAASALLDAHKHIANALNVFPVPDGDTGTNMSMTMSAVADAARREAGGGSSAEAVSRAMARIALMEGRGNSGVILSQFFRGLSEGLSGRESFDSGDMASALEAAAERSYGAVVEPVEGTMLTVIAAAAAEARRSADAGLGLAPALESVCEVAADTVEATEDMLPVLKEAGVVDSGGYGIQVILNGMAIRAAGGSVSGVEVPVPGGAPEAAVALSEEFLERTEHVGFGYCTQLLVRAAEGEGAEPDLGEIRRRAGELASSVVVVGDAELVKIHVHTERPDEMVDYAGTLGEIIDRSVQDMDAQRVEFAAAHRGAAADPGQVSLLAVCAGPGLSAVFAEQGAYEVVAGGPTMNPSVRDMAEAIDRCPSAAAMVLPNDGNVVATARQAAELASKPALVVPTETVQQGVAAAIAFDPGSEPDANLEMMAEAAGEVISASVTIATRDVTLDGVRAEAGGYIGVLDGALAAAGPSLSRVLDELLAAAGVDEDHLVTLYRGEPVSDEESAAELARLKERFGDAEFDLIVGGQPHYHYLVSIE